MICANYEGQCKKVFHYYQNITCGDKAMTYSHFQEEGINKSIIRTILQRFESNNASAYKEMTGRPQARKSILLANKIRQVEIKP